METITEVDEMFAAEATDNVMETMSELAEQIALEDAAVKDLETEISEKKQQLDAAKEQLHNLMVQNNCANGHKFDNGLYLKPKVKTDVFKSKAVPDEQLFDWLRTNNLAEIIKPTVHWLTLSSTMKAEMERGRDLPEIFNVVNKRTVHFVGNGRAKFLAERQAIVNADSPAA